MIKVTDKFYADGVEWEVTHLPLKYNSVVILKNGSKELLVWYKLKDFCSPKEFVVKKFDDDEIQVELAEVRMCLEIIEKLKGESK